MPVSKRPQTRPFPARLRHYREAEGLTQSQLASRLGVSAVTVLRWENGSAKPSQLAAKKLQEVGFGTISQAETNRDEVPRRKLAAEATLWEDPESVLTVDKLRDAVRPTIKVGRKRREFMPAPYVYNGPESQLEFFEMLYALQEEGAGSIEKELLADRLSLVASVPGLSQATSQSRLEAPKQSRSHWNANYGPHGWHRYIGRFPPHLVRAVLNGFGASASSTVLDPFAGSGTLLAEARMIGIPSIGIEICPLSSLICEVKSQFPQDGDAIRRTAGRFEDFFEERWPSDQRVESMTNAEVLARPGNVVPTFPNHDRWMTTRALLGTSIAAEFAQQQRGFARRATLVALSSKMRSIGNVDVDVARAEYRKTPREGVDVLRLVTSTLKRMADDVDRTVATHQKTIGPPSSVAVLNSSCLEAELEPNSVDFVVTSPPYGVEASSYLRSHLLSYRCLEEFLGVDPYAFGERAIGSEYVGDESLIGPNQNAGEQSNTFTRFFDDLIHDALPKKHRVRAFMMMHFFDDLAQLARRLAVWVRPNGRVALVMGNKKVGDSVVPADEILLEVFAAAGFKHERTMAHKLKCNNSNSQVPWQERVIQDEFILFFRRR